ncbi:MAG: transporter substrate-binding domain-containing protein [Bacteroidia bacterium]|nr:transporter substrate-binding domain-containing protein [Bacteroidia bacterium]
MKKLCILSFLFLINTALFSKTKDSLFIHYFENNPFSYSEGTSIKGIEIEIITEYIKWLKTNKNQEVYVQYKGFFDFDSFLSSVKTANKNTFGLGTLTITQERKKELDFTDPVLKNVAFCITNGHAPDVNIKNKEELLKVFGKMSAVTIPNSSLHAYLMDLKKSYLPELKFNFQPNPQKILDEISKNVLQFGYVDAVSFWIYLKNNPGRYLKMQKTLNQSKEELGFITPKGSEHTALFNEFFSGAQGFKYSKTYRSLLEKHLGSYMTQNMAIY